MTDDADAILKWIEKYIEDEDFEPDPYDRALLALRDEVEGFKNGFSDPHYVAHRLRAIRERLGIDG